MDGARPYGPEGPECEWKERLPRPPRLARTLAAFANGVGGSLWIGVEDRGGVVGVGNPRDVHAALRHVAEEWVEPVPALQIVRHRVAGRTLLEGRIAPASDGPVRALLPSGERRVYVRDGASSRPATAAQVKAMGARCGRAPRLDATGRRLLALLTREGPHTLATLTRAARMGRRNARRALVALARAGLVQEAPDGGLSLTPLGHRRARPQVLAAGERRR